MAESQELCPQLVLVEVKMSVRGNSLLLTHHLGWLVGLLLKRDPQVLQGTARLWAAAGFQARDDPVQTPLLTRQSQAKV